MRIRQNTSVRRKLVLCLPLCILLCASLAGAQTTRRDNRPTPQRTPATIVAPPQRAPSLITHAGDFNCSGFIELDPASVRNQTQIVGGEQEQEQNIYTDGDYVYLNAGSQQGLTVGQEFAVVRPRGRFSSRFSSKRGTLGVFTQQIGHVRVTSVKANASVAILTNSCEMALLGDVLRPIVQQHSGETLARMTGSNSLPLERFADPSGKQQGRIVMARNGQEMLAANQVVFIDLGREDNVRPGDRLTIFRPVGTPRVARTTNEEITDNTHGGFESERFRGGTFSGKAQRAREPNGTGLFDQKPVTSPEIKRTRPALPRKIVGEMLILNVESRTATALITRTAQEVHTGDFVEMQ